MHLPHYTFTISLYFLFFSSFLSLLILLLFLLPSHITILGYFRKLIIIFKN